MPTPICPAKMRNTSMSSLVNGACSKRLPTKATPANFPATIIGTIKTPVLIIEEGVRFDGKCDMLAKEEKKVSPITPEKGIRIAGVKGAD